MVIHHGHGVPVGQHTLIQNDQRPDTHSNAALQPLDSHDPYPCDGEGRQADRQNDPGSHRAGRDTALSRAWVETGASDTSNGTTGPDGGWVGAGGSLLHGETHEGGQERKEGRRHGCSAPQDPATSMNLKYSRRNIIKLISNQRHLHAIQNAT